MYAEFCSLSATNYKNGFQSISAFTLKKKNKFSIIQRTCVKIPRTQCLPEAFFFQGLQNLCLSLKPWATIHQTWARHFTLQGCCKDNAEEQRTLNAIPSFLKKGQDKTYYILQPRAQRALKKKKKNLAQQLL